MSILRRPLVTEKVSALNEKGRFGFIVDKNATKVQIKREVEKIYGVNVESVNTINVLGKKKSRFSKTGTISGRKPDHKKALVTLAKGETIDFYSNV